MAFFESYFDNGKIQYSSDFRAYSLIKSGQISDKDFTYSTVNHDGQSIATASISYPIGFGLNYENPILFVRPATGDLGAINARLGGYSSGKPTEKCASIFRWHNLKIKGNIQYYLFAQAKKIGGNYGLQIFDGNNNLMLDSNWGLLNITNIITTPAYTPKMGQSGYYVPNFTLKPQQAICMPHARSGYLEILGTAYQLREGVWLDTSNRLGIGWVLTNASNSGGIVNIGHANHSTGMMLICETNHLPSNYSI
ncbi:hypothetical protein [Lonepinella sp. BR2930]|uniref:hypothetical protein n=1 Tax=Lonepinella sp. BR2930 TaxID=3434554 RepID=UPI003F6DE8FC